MFNNSFILNSFYSRFNFLKEMFLSWLDEKLVFLLIVFIELLSGIDHGPVKIKRNKTELVPSDREIHTISDIIILEIETKEER